jgi:hypothetical protein
MLDENLSLLSATAPDPAPPPLLPAREAVAQTKAVQISCHDLTSTIWPFESNHSSQVVDAPQEPSDDAGLELAGARLCALYNARPLRNSHT